MGDIGLLKQGWNWVLSWKGSRIDVSCSGEKFGVTMDRHWPMVSRWFCVVGRLLFMLLLYWRDCIFAGFRSMFGLGSAAVLVIVWSGFLSFTSMSCLVYVLLSLGAAGAAIHYLGSTPGLFIVGSFGILVMWIYGNLWIAGLLFISAGYMFSLNQAKVLISISATYAVYYVYTNVGLLGLLLSLNLAFISNDLLNKLVQGYDGGANEGTHFEEHKESETFSEDFQGDTKYFPQSPPVEKAENVASCQQPCKAPVTPAVLNVQKDASSSKVVKAESTSVDEIQRIMNSSNHYEALGFPRRNSIDPMSLRREYRRMAVLVHPDKNMGNPLASESFKKLQCAYEVLSDLTKKNNYDEQLRKEESKRVIQNPRSTSRQDGLGFQSEESRRIECTKCSNSHIWICTTRRKFNARWCQDCSEYHQAKDGEGWVEYRCSQISSGSQKVDIPRAFVCAESKIFDVSEWAICQGVAGKPNTHRPSFHVNMVGSTKSMNRTPHRYPWGLDAEMVPEDDEFELWFQQALASGLFSDSPKRRKSWSPFKIQPKSLKSWRRSP